MINDEPSVKEMIALWNICIKFIEEQEIVHEEMVYQSDHIAENALQLIGQICEEVGYVEYEDE